jgi:hypothetical protein
LKELQKDRFGRQLQNSEQVPREEWPNLLRIIDARDSGVGFEEIGKSLLGYDPGDPAGYEPTKVAAAAKSKHNTARNLFRLIRAKR